MERNVLLSNKVSSATCRFTFLEAKHLTAGQTAKHYLRSLLGI